MSKRSMVLPGRFVTYCRVSTAEQGRSGLGIEAQQAAVRGYLDGNGGSPVAEFVEIESGRKRNRPELVKALAACRLHKATLVIAKLDRLARDAAFLLNLRDAGVEFVACDMPDANRLTVGIMAMVAEDEAERISARTKAALAAAKARGVKLGGYAGYVPRKADREAGVAAAKRNAAQRAERLRETVDELRVNGATGPAAVARELNRLDITTDRGGAWSTTQAARLLARLAPPVVETGSRAGRKAA